MMTQAPVIAVVPAAGIGSRMQADRPKQYLTLAGRTILEHTLAGLHQHPQIDRVVVAIAADDPYFAQLPMARAPWLEVVTGGAERADSVLQALSTLPADSWALVHDAARPCLEAADVDALLASRHNPHTAGAILASPVRDTMKRAVSGADPVCIARTESRDGLWHALTPQLFHTGQLRQALSDGLARGLTITDEASAMEAAGYAVALVEGNPGNIKITRPADLALAEFYLASRADRLA